MFPPSSLLFVLVIPLFYLSFSALPAADVLCSLIVSIISNGKIIVNCCKKRAAAKELRRKPLFSFEAALLKRTYNLFN